MAIEHASFSVGRGRTLLLGPNGAGKSTLLLTIAGLLPPRAGEVEVLGGSPQVARGRVGLMAQDVTAVRGLTVLDQVTFAGWLAGLGRPEARRAAEGALATVGMDDLVDRPSNRLSGGQLRRVGLAEALTRPVELLLLDEPTAGLDPVARADFLDVLTRVDCPVIVSTHELDGLDEVCDDVVVLSGRRVSFAGSMVDFCTIDGRRVSPASAYVARSRGGAS